MIKYKCDITGGLYSEATVQSKLSNAYREWYTFEPKGACEGCGYPATCTAHIIPKARCKQLNLTSLIWTRSNTFRACYKCNGIAENISGEEIKTLLNYDNIVFIYKLWDNERYQKLIQ